MFLVKFVESVHQRFALLFEVTCHLCCKHACNNTVLVAHISTLQVSATFLKAQNVSFGMALSFQFGNDVTNVFETCQNVAYFRAKFLCDGVCHDGCNNGFYNNGVFWQFVFFRKASKDVVAKENAHFVTAKSASAVTCVYNNAKAVAVGVVCNNDVCATFLQKFNCQSKRLFLFGVGVTASWEVPIWCCLFRYNYHVFEAYALKHFGHNAPTSTVKWCVNNFETINHIQTLGYNNILVALFNCVIHKEDCFAKVVVKVTKFAFKWVYLADKSNNFHAGLVHKLATKFVVNFVAVVFAWVVACCDVDTNVATKVAHHKGQKWCWHTFLCDVHLDAVPSKCYRSSFAEQFAVKTAVVCDGATSEFVRNHVSCQTFRRAENCVNVQSVGTCRHNTAKSRCTKLKFAVEGVFDLLGVAFHLL